MAREIVKRRRVRAKLEVQAAGLKQGSTRTSGFPNESLLPSRWTEAR